MSGYSDKRSDFFRHYFEKALPYADYLKSGEPGYRARWESNSANTTLTPNQKALLGSFTRKLNVLIMSGIWCGDCARQGPMFQQIEVNCPTLTARFIDNKENPELQSELRLNGAEKVPVVVVLSEDFFELARFGDKHLSVYRRKAATELGPACEVGFESPPTEHLQTEIQEWVDFLERAQLMLRLAPMLRRRYND